MPVIDPNGIFDGDRINSCSIETQLYYPRMLCASNGLGRIQINYVKIVAVAFPRWVPHQIPPEPVLMGYFKEYAEKRLIFLYGSSGQVWGQWDAKKNTFGRYPTKADMRSPAPPDALFSKWLDDNRKYSVKTSTAMAYFDLHEPARDLAKDSQKIPENSCEISQKDSEKFPNGIGVGDGIRCEVLGIGVGKKPSRAPRNSSPKQKPSSADAEASLADPRWRDFIDDWKTAFEHVTSKTFKPSDGDFAVLKKFLLEHPDMNRETWRNCWNNWKKSSISHLKPLRFWGARILEYEQGPLDKFWEPIKSGEQANGHGYPKTGAAGRTARNLAVLVPEVMGSGIQGSHVPDGRAIQPGVVGRDSRRNSRVSDDAVLAQGDEKSKPNPDA